MNWLKIINKYYPDNSNLRALLIDHSAAVARKALEIAERNPQFKTDNHFIEEASMLHDIGIFLTFSPKIGCFGEKPYVCHGYLGRELIEKEGLPKHALVCERHVGTGFSVEDIIRRGLPIPHRDMRPVSIEEEIICFADKFYSKSKGAGQEKKLKKVIKSLAKHGEENVERFEYWMKKFNYQDHW